VIERTFDALSVDEAVAREYVRAGRGSKTGAFCCLQLGCDRSRKRDEGGESEAPIAVDKCVVARDQVQQCGGLFVQ
jgi:hypothetical protein